MSSSFNAGNLTTVQSSKLSGGSLRASSYTQGTISNMRCTVAYAPSSDIHIVTIDQSASLTTVIADCMRKHQITDVRKQYALEAEVGSQQAKVTSVNDLRDCDKLHVVEVKASRDGDRPVRSASNSQPDAKRECIHIDDDDSDKEPLSIRRRAKRPRFNRVECEIDEADREAESYYGEDSDSKDENSDGKDEDSDSEDEDSDSEDEEETSNATHMPRVHTRIRPGANNQHTIGRKVDSYDRRF
jgi:hypothetical protein